MSNFLDAYWLFFQRVFVPVTVIALVLRIVGFADWLVAIIWILMLIKVAEDDSGN